MDYGERLAAHLRNINPAYVEKDYYVLITDEDGEGVHQSLLDLVLACKLTDEQYVWM